MAVNFISIPTTARPTIVNHSPKKEVYFRAQPQADTISFGMAKQVADVTKKACNSRPVKKFFNNIFNRLGKFFNNLFKVNKGSNAVTQNQATSKFVNNIKDDLDDFTEILANSLV